jgi:hypothetical protein
MQCPVAGFQFHFGERCWPRMRQGDDLTLRREPGNHHDARAVRVEWKGEMLGYLPREANYAVSQMLDRGVPVEARIAGMRFDKDPWHRVMIEVATLVDAPLTTGPTRAPYDAHPQPPARSPTPIALSLANRIFGAPATAQQVNWAFEHAGALALVGIEHPALLPFFQLFLVHDTLLLGTDACSALRNLLEAAGLPPGGWKRLEKWGFEAFRRFAHAETCPDADHIAAYGNLLMRLDVQAPPVALFSRLAWQCAAWEVDFDPAMLDTFPTWFMRALLRECEGAKVASRAAEIEAELAMAIQWAVATQPEPDANQQHAGWPWIAQQARAHVEKARARTWPVPIGEVTCRAHVVVPIRSAVELREEAEAMANCLATYEEGCAYGEIVVFSIRTRASGKRVACFAIACEDDRWELVQVVGKANSPVSAEIEAIAHQVLQHVVRSAG